MLTLITGGSASGKSDFAEMLCASLNAGTMYYVATMKPGGNEAAERIERHRKRRADKNFITVECPCHTDMPQLPGEYEKTVILLEDLGNLVANEQFDTGGTDEDITARVMSCVCSLCRKAAYVYVVGDDIFSDTEDYDAETLRYIRLLGSVTSRIAELADNVYQVVFGTAIPLKEKNSGDTEHGKE